MKASRYCLFLALTVLMLPRSSFGQCGPDVLYLTNPNQSGYTCNATLDDVNTSFEIPVQLHAVCRYRPDGLSQLSMRLENLPPSSEMGEVNFNWFADEVSGDPSTGITLQWDEPTTNFVVGELVLHFNGPFWLEEGIRIQAQDVSIIDDRGEVHELWGSGFSFNCELGNLNCNCLDFVWDPPVGWYDVRYVWPDDGLTLPSQFDLSFEAEAWACQVGYPSTYTCTVSVDGEPIATFDGEGEGNYTLPMDFTGITMGTEVEVVIYLSTPAGYHASETLHYIIDDSVAAAPTSFSVVKSLY